MSNYVKYGDLSADGSTDTVACRGWATLSAHQTAGAGTFTWEFKGVDGVWRTILGQSDHITPETYTTSCMTNVFFGTDITVRGTASASAGVTWQWQIMSNPVNRDN